VARPRFRHPSQGGGFLLSERVMPPYSFLPEASSIFLLPENTLVHRSPCAPFCTVFFGHHVVFFSELLCCRLSFTPLQFLLCFFPASIGSSLFPRGLSLLPRRSFSFFPPVVFSLWLRTAEGGCRRSPPPPIRCFGFPLFFHVLGVMPHPFAFFLLGVSFAYCRLTTFSVAASFLILIVLLFVIPVRYPPPFLWIY